MPVSFKQVLNAFQTLEIADPERFSGRVRQIESGCALLLNCTSIFIHGVRGIGKSSLALQLERIANGDKRLLARINSPFANESFGYATCFIRRDDSINNINALLYRIMIDHDGLARWTDLLPTIGPVPPFELTGPLNANLLGEFWNRLAAVVPLADDGVAIFVDEFERITDRMGFASVIKALPKKCMFVVTGIAETEKQLVGDHESIERQLGAGKLLVQKMSNDELRLIIENAEDAVDGEIRFEESGTARLIEIAKGHPYLVHLVGRTAMTTAFLGKASTVSEKSLEQAISEIATGRVESFLHERYLSAIGNSMGREIVLRVFAADTDSAVSTAVAYPKAKRLGVANPSYYVGDLQKRQFGSELVKVAENNYAIADSLFRAYVIATPPRLYTLIDAEDDDGFGEAGSNLEFFQNKEGVYKVKAPSNDGELTLVQLSDLHFGDGHYFSTLSLASDSIPESDRPSLLKYLSQALLTGGDPPPPAVLVISGDVTQRGVTTEFDQGRSFVRQILPRLDAPENSYSSRVVIVPGNHDVNWGAFNADPGNRSLPFSGFISFANEFGSAFSHTLEPERICRVHDLVQEFGVIIAAFNSAVIESATDHRGYIGETQLVNVLAEVDAVQGDRKAVRIAVLHHHLTSVPTLEASLGKPDEVLRDVALVKQKLIDARFALVLHGHRHHSHLELVGNEHHRMLVCGCGSTGVSQKERGGQPLQFNWISITSRLGKTTITVRPYQFDVVRRAWLPSPSSPHVYQIP